MDNTKNAPILEIDHHTFLKAIDNLVNQIGKKSKYTCIVPVPNGGIIPAVYLFNRLSIPLKSIDGYFNENEKILFVEDVIDTGKTIEKLEKEGIITSDDDIATIAFKPWSTRR